MRIRRLPNQSHRGWPVRRWVAPWLALWFAAAFAAPGWAAPEGGADGFLQRAMHTPTAICPTMTLEAIAKALVVAPEWEMTTGTDGAPIVNVKGFLARNNNKLVVVRVQHVFDAKLNELRYRQMDITGIVQPEQTYTVLMKRECDSSLSAKAH